MRLKEIKPYMAIRCENAEQVYELNKQMKSDKCFEDFLSFPCYILTDKNGFSGWVTGRNKDFISSDNYDPVPKIVEFSDLIIPDLTAAEAVQWIVLHYEDGVYAEAFGVDYRIEFLLDDMSAEEVVSKIAQWKSDHEKKEPEIETADICRIIEIQPGGRKLCVHEEDIDLPFDGYERQKVEEILKRYCMEHDGEYIAVHEVVSRVKVVE